MNPDVYTLLHVPAPAKELVKMCAKSIKDRELSHIARQAYTISTVKERARQIIEETPGSQKASMADMLIRGLEAHERNAQARHLLHPATLN